MIFENIILPIDYTEEDMRQAVLKAAHKKNPKKKLVIRKIRLLRRSIDARKKPELFYVCRIAVNEEIPELVIPRADENLQVTVCGTGPAGLFAALVLTEAGAKVTLLERGKPVEERIRDTERFFETGELNEESNVQFGEGGAGTFSDGKLNTLIKDKKNYGSFVLKTFYEAGAQEAILVDAKPHIGTDVLVKVIKNLREKLVNQGAEFRFSSRLEDIAADSEGRLFGITVNGQSLPCERLVLACGHSARDTYQMLYDRGVHLEQKPFAVGIRIEHPQEMITLSQYGTLDYEELGAAPYKVTYQASNGRGVYSFCMCPGGYVVNASSEKGHLAVNGMSYAARDSRNANSGIVVQIRTSDYEDEHPLAGMVFQRELEKRAYEKADGDIPVQTWKDFSEGIETTDAPVKPEMRGKYRFSDLHGIFPAEIEEALKEAIPAFGKRIRGFDRDDCLLSAVESRTSSPVRILRDETYQTNLRGIYPAGEGAGYAGGIMSAAIDGMETAFQILEEYLTHG